MKTTQKKSGLLLAAAVFGLVCWIALIIAVIISGKNAQVQVQVGFFEGMSNLAKELFRGGKGSGWMRYGVAFFLSIPAAAVLSLIAYFKVSKKAAYLSAILSLVSFNFISIILCVVGARPAFLQGRKTMLFIAAYMGIVFALLSMGSLFIINDDQSAIPFFVYIIITLLIAAVLNITGWLKNNALMTLIASIVYVLSVLGIPSAILCVIGARPAFLQGRKTMLFIAAYIGVFTLLALGLLAIVGGASDTSTIPFFVYVIIVLLIAAVLNIIGWLKNNTLMTLIASIVYVLSVLGIPSAVLCFIGFAKLKKRSA